MSLNLGQLLPHARPWVEGLAQTFPGVYIKPGFAFWEVGHILSLITLGGTTILMNLRLLGAGITDAPPSEIYRNLRVLQNLGVIGIVVTGVLIGTANAERLYDSAAFVVKMLALIAGLILTYGASRRVAAADGAVDGTSKAWFAAGVSVFLLGLWVFALSKLINPGVFHIITAAALIVPFATRGQTRQVYLSGLIVLIAAHFVGVHVITASDDYAGVDAIDKTFAWLFTGWIGGIALFALFRSGRGEAGGPLTKMIAYSTILVWVTAAAAGRWIAFA